MAGQHFPVTRLEGVSREQFMQHLYPQVSLLRGAEPRETSGRRVFTIWTTGNWFLETQGVEKRRRTAADDWLALRPRERCTWDADWLLY